MKTALIAGANGLIGKQLLHMLLDSPRYSKVIALARRDLPISHARLEKIITGLPDMKEKISPVHADDIYCCLGSTMAKAGSKEKFYEADFTYPFGLAKIMKANGASQYLLVSAMGADKNSSIYYNRVKGEVEEAVSKTGFHCLHFFRPSLLLGDREESRPGETAAKVIFKLFGFLIPTKYKGIRGSQVAKAMLYYASLEDRGILIHESDELLKLSL